MVRRSCCAATRAALGVDAAGVFCIRSVASASACGMWPMGSGRRGWLNHETRCSVASSTALRVCQGPRRCMVSAFLQPVDGLGQRVVVAVAGAHDVACEDVNDEGDVGDAWPGRDVGQIGHLRLVRPFSLEPPGQPVLLDALQLGCRGARAGASVALTLANPRAQGLARAADLDRDRFDRCPLRRVLVLGVEDHAHRGRADCRMRLVLRARCKHAHCELTSASGQRRFAGTALFAANRSHPKEEHGHPQDHQEV